MSKAKHWCFTLNNYGEDDLYKLSPTSSHLSESSCSYLIYQKEIGKKGTKHLQGFASFSQKVRIAAVKAILGDKAHLEVAKGTPKQNTEYCSKDSTREVGTVPISYGSIAATNPGKRNDLLQFREACDDGTMTLKRANSDFITVAAKYPRYVQDSIRFCAPKPSLAAHPYRAWQERLKAILDEEPNDREIIFVVDEVGNLGKTWFAKRYCRDNPDVSQYMEPGKKADMAYSLETGLRTLFVNVTRQHVEHLQYSFLEAVKDGMIFSPKYESCTKEVAPMHVVVLMNRDPDMTLLSEDRYLILRINE